MTFWSKQKTKKIGVTLIHEGVLSAASYEIQEDGKPHLIAKKSLSLQSGAAEQKREFRLFVSGSACRHATWAHIILREKAFTKKLQLPTKNSAEIKQMISLRLPHEVPSTVDEIVFHIHQLTDESQSSTATDLMLFVVSKENVNKDLTVLKEVGINPECIFLSTVALAAILHHEMLPRVQTPRLVIYGMQGKGEILLMHRGSIEFSRCFDYDPSEGVVSLNAALRPLLQTLEREKKLVDCELLFLGEPATVEGTDIETRFPRRAKSEMRHAANEDPLYQLMSGVPLLASEEYREYNLLPHEAKKQIEAGHAEVRWVGLRTAVMSLMLSIMTVWIALAARSWITVAFLDHKIFSLAPQASEIREVAKKIEWVRKLGESKTRALDLVAQIHEKAADGIALSELDYEETNDLVRMKGQASAQPLVDQFVRSLSEVSLFKRVELKYSERSRSSGSGEFAFAIEAAVGEKK